MKVLICESEEILLAAIEFRLKKQGLEVVYSKKKASILEDIVTHKPDLVIVDADMGRQAGLEIIQEIQNQGSSAKILLLVDPDEEELTAKALLMGIADFLSKPFKPSELILRVKKSLNILLIKG
ncbi:response regulator [Haliscomenobacter sp.]|jgi:DNA-binding response OmpR family regulator|uniref:response regulator transcription factor n=1 Tax=Haliscomenobacter sp. TaxID=2717303 RepID=UPI003364CDF2